MSRGLGAVQREILEIIAEEDLGKEEYLPINVVLSKMKASPLYPQSKAQTIWRAIRRLEQLGHIEAKKIIDLNSFLLLSLKEKRKMGFRIKHIRLAKRLVNRIK